MKTINKNNKNRNINRTMNTTKRKTIKTNKTIRTKTKQ
jgi:hypothetical protein